MSEPVSGNHNDLFDIEVQFEEVRKWDEAYSQNYQPYFRLDFKVGFRWNSKKVTQEFMFDIQNVTDQQNALLQRYNATTQSVDVSNQLGRFPMMQYRIQF